MGEKEFWTYYVRSRFFGQSSNRSISSAEEGEHNPLNEYYEEITLKNDLDEELLAETTISRAVDLTATAEDHPSDINNRIAQHLRSQHGNETLSLIKKFNNHSLKIIHNSMSRAPPVQIKDTLELEDLNAKVDVNTMALELKPIERKNEAMVLDIEASVDEEFREATKNITIDVLPFVLNNFRDYNEISKLFTLDHVQTAPSSSQSTHIPNGSDIDVFHSNAAEVLRHFWAIHPTTKDVESQSKLTRMTTILEQLIIKGKSIISSRHNLQERVDTETLLSAILNAIEYAVEKRKHKEIEHNGKRMKLNE
jgi:hypothetical protein